MDMKKSSPDYSHRFWVFQGDTYYPSRGMLDFYTSFDTAQEYLAFCANVRNLEWVQIFDTQTHQVVWEVDGE